MEIQEQTMPAGLPPATTTLGAKLLNILASPGEVFDEVLGREPCLANYRVPTLLVGLTGIILLQASGSGEQATASARALFEAGAVSAARADALAGLWKITAALALCLAVFAGTAWSAFVLWLIGRLFLKRRFSYLKTLEVAGLAGIVLVLGAIVTLLLIAVSGDPATRPSLVLLAGRPGAAGAKSALLDSLDFFQLWSAALLAVGLSKLSGVTFKESAFWVFAYWVAARVALILLA